VEELLAARERAAMFAEDLATHAITGRVAMNESQIQPSPRWRRWSLWRRQENMRDRMSDRVETWGQRSLGFLNRIRVTPANREAIAEARAGLRVITGDSPVHSGYTDDDLLDANGRLVRPYRADSEPDSEGSDAMSEG
jgi:hypothetical protein